MDYLLLLEQIKAIVDHEIPLVSNLSNVAALLNQLEDINWAGFYIAYDDALYLGPFQGEVACTKIPFDKGVCGACYKAKATLIVPDVNKFPGHIACSSKSKSEIVTPIILDDKVVALIDIDAPIYDRFNQNDQKLLEEVANIIKDLFHE